MDVDSKLLKHISELKEVSVCRIYALSDGWMSSLKKGLNKVDPSPSLEHADEYVYIYIFLHIHSQAK